MPFLVSVDAALDTYSSRTLDVTFSTTSPLRVAADTAVLLVSDASGSEFGIRLERGQVTDVHLWDAARRIRQRLPLHNVTIRDTSVSCSIPTAVLPPIASAARISASLVVNGALVQWGFPVTAKYGPAARSTNSVPTNAVPTKQLVNEGRNDG